MHEPAAEGMRNDAPPRRPGLPLLVVLCAIVLAFRAAAWLTPSAFIVIPGPMLLPLNLLGILHLVCGVWAWCLSPSRLTRVFLVSTIGSAVHWGGSAGAANEGLEIAFLMFYAAVTAIGDAALLDLALRYPSVEARCGLRAYGLYLVGALALVAVPVAAFVPRTVVEAGLGIVISVSFAMSIAAGLVFVIGWFRSTPERRREHRLTAIVVVLVGTSVLNVIGDQGVLPGEPEVWTLPYALVPITLAWALTRKARTASVAIG